MAKTEVYRSGRSLQKTYERFSLELGVLEGYTTCLRLCLMPLREGIARGADGYWRTLRWRVFEKLKRVGRVEWERFCAGMLLCLVKISLNSSGRGRRDSRFWVAK